MIIDDDEDAPAATKVRRSRAGQVAMAKHNIYGSGMVLDGVETWSFSSGAFLLRETGVIRDGRLDGLLFPTSWDANLPAGLWGVEVKVSRSDFQRGLREGQFEKYSKQITGLYLATGHDVCKTSEVPKGVGHLIVTRTGAGLICSCRRKAREVNPLATLDPLIVYRCIVDLVDQERKIRRQWQKDLCKAQQRINDKGSEIIASLLRQKEDHILPS